MNWRDLMNAQLDAGGFVGSALDTTDKTSAPQPRTPNDVGGVSRVVSVLSVESAGALDREFTLLSLSESLLTSPIEDASPLSSTLLPNKPTEPTKPLCALCRHKHATIGDRCRWCEAVRGREVVYVPGSPVERVFLAELEAVASGRYAVIGGRDSTPPRLPPLGRPDSIISPAAPPDQPRTCLTCSRMLYQDPGGFIDRGEPCFMCRRTPATKAAA
jgi:hypothetical protein